MIRLLSIQSIRFYQTYISPHKGYSCAYGVCNGGSSCSHEVIHIIETTSVLQWPSNIRQQFNECSLAYESLEEEKKNNQFKKYTSLDSICLYVDCCSVISFT